MNYLVLNLGYVGSAACLLSVLTTAYPLHRLLLALPPFSPVPSTAPDTQTLLVLCVASVPGLCWVVDMAQPTPAPWQETDKKDKR